MSKLSLNTEALDEPSQVRNLTINGNLNRLRQMPKSEDSESIQLEQLRLFAMKLGLNKADQFIFNHLNK